MILPNYEGTADEYAKYGNNLNIWRQLQLLQAWAPLIGYGQRFDRPVQKIHRSK
jgi:hypothetical protein